MEIALLKRYVGKAKVVYSVNALFELPFNKCGTRVR